MGSGSSSGGAAWVTLVYPPGRSVFIATILSEPEVNLKFRDATLDDVAQIAALQNAAAGALTARFGVGAGRFYLTCGYEERGHVVYKGNPLVYYELLLHATNAE